MTARRGCALSAEQSRGADVPAIEDEDHLKFITGFPCTKFNCPGTLAEGVHAGETVVQCSTCEHVYYRFAGD